MSHTHSIGRLSSCITHLSHLYLTQHLQQHGLTSGQLHLLMCLYRQEGIHQETLAHDLLLDKTTCARAIKKLENAGFITKKQDPNDKRAYRLYLTPKAHTLEKQIRTILTTWRTILLNDFTPDDQQQFIIYLNRAIQNAHNHLYQKNQKETTKL